MFFYVYLTDDSVYIVVIHKRIQFHPLINAPVFVKFPPDGVGNFKVIVVIVSGIKALVQFIIGNTVEHTLSVPDITAVISVNHLAHKPEIPFLCLRSSPHFFHKRELQTVCTVQTNTVNVKRIDPEINDSQQVFPHSRFP